MTGKLRNMTSIYLLRKDRILLLHRQGGAVADGLWVGSAGGHFEDYELNDAAACVLREMQEELGLRSEHIENLTLRYITLRSTRGEIRQNYYFFATLVDWVDPDALVSNEGECRWLSLDEVTALNMPFTAKYVMEHYVREGRFTDTLYAGAAGADGVSFSPLPEN
ncbi:MAG: NUDIX domain-containing protein [Clostridia bacterium]|nr:NUDIX domain-containing protein [Clostridia bacterium]